MQNNILKALFVAAIAITPAVAISLTASNSYAQTAPAALPPALQAAIMSGNADAVRSVVMALSGGNQERAGAFAAALLDRASALISVNPTAALAAYQGASAYAGLIPAGMLPTATANITTVLNTVNTSSFQNANPQAAASFLSASLAIASKPNVVNASPNLYASVLTASNSFLNTQGGSTSPAAVQLEAQVSQVVPSALTQTPTSNATQSGSNPTNPTVQPVQEQPVQEQPGSPT